MNIWCEFDEDWLKTLLCRVHTVQNKVGPLVSLIGEENALGLRLWPNEYFFVNLKILVENSDL